MNALPLLCGALAVLAIGYRYYSAFIAARILALDDRRPTPAHERRDGQNFVPTNRWVLFGHHFAAITGAGPLIGPVLACQYGYAPGFLWLVSGVVLAGAVHDFVMLGASIRHGGRSLAEIAREEISPLAGALASFAILIVLVVAIAAMGFAVVNSMKNDAWGAFTLAASIPLAMLMGLRMAGGGRGAIAQASVLGVLGLVLAVIFGGWASGLGAGAPWRELLERWFALGPRGVAWAVAAYGFAASVLPVWLLLTPRDYLSSYLKLGTIAALVVGVLVVHPTLLAPAVSEYVHGGGPIVPGKLFPFVFITIACGAISGFHSLIATGTTPKMLAQESDARPIGYGAMLCEGLVGVTCLIAASALHPADYYAINATAEVFQHLGLHPIDLAALERDVGTPLAGKTGGAVSLAVGMAKIFASLPVVRNLPRILAYWYHFAIVFEGLFILTTVDAGTRVARFMLQEVLGRLHPALGRPGFWPAAVATTGLTVSAWTWLIFAALADPRGMGVLWTLLGVANQLLAVIALTVGTTWIVNLGKARYAWVTLLPLAWVATTTFSGGVLTIAGPYWRMLQSPGTRSMGLLCAGGIGAVMLSALVILLDGARRWTLAAASGRGRVGSSLEDM
ncbi:MAG: carbon starvation CstA family protein [Deltaproteobacteria bacterium]